METLTVHRLDLRIKNKNPPKCYIWFGLLYEYKICGHTEEEYAKSTTIIS